MDIKIEGFYTENVEFFQDSINVRNEIFVNELNFDKHLEFDGKDDLATHYIVLYDGIPAGCSRWIEDKEKIRIDRFGIKKEYRGKGLGLLLIKFIKSELKPVSKKIELLSIEENVVFFIQQGFKDSNVKEEFKNKKVRVLNL
jgi:predicted GNAT family N-acyltransferase